MSLVEIIDYYFEHLLPITIFCGSIVCAISFFWRKGDEAIAIDSIAKGATSSAFPSGLAFVLCAAFPGYVPKVADATLAFFVGGLALMIIPFIDFRKVFHASAAPQADRSKLPDI
ncbi:hypothetical protein QEL91_002250 [Pseudomonas putida]|nr:hypothetical protein [Pseudomonas putida]